MFKLGCLTESEGIAYVNAKLLTELINGVSADKISIHSENDKVTVKSDNFESDINTVSEIDYPETPTLTESKEMFINREKILEGLSNVSYAASTDETRLALSTVKIIIENNSCIFVATDSFRLSEYIVDIESDGSIELLIPLKAVNELVRLLGYSDVEKVKISYSKEVINIDLGEVILFSQLSTFNYPDYKKIIPDRDKFSAIVDSSELLSAVKLADVIAKDNSHIIKLDFKESIINIKSSQTEKGKNNIEVEANHTGEELEVSINAKYLIDYLVNSKIDEIKFTSNGVLDPLLITPIDESVKFTHLIMPLKN